MLASLLSLHLALPREVWVKKRSNVWWEQIVNSTFTSSDWLENFWMSRSTFIYLHSALRHTIQKRGTTIKRQYQLRYGSHLLCGVCQPLQITGQLAIFLVYQRQQYVLLSKTSVRLLLRSCCHGISIFPLVTPSERLCMVLCISGDFHNVAML